MKSLALKAVPFTNVPHSRWYFFLYLPVDFLCGRYLEAKPTPTESIKHFEFCGLFSADCCWPDRTTRGAYFPQLENFRFRWDKKAIETGLTWIILGLFFKRCPG
jgi:hypothetical protein